MSRLDLRYEALRKRSPSREARLLASLAEAGQQVPVVVVAGGEDGRHVLVDGMKHLVPLARANREAAVRLAAALGPHRPTSRQVAAPYGAWMGGSEATREELVRDPGLFFLRAREAARRPPDPAEQGPAAVLLADLGALGGVARRGLRHLRDGLAERLAAPERDEVRRALAQAKTDALQLFVRCEEEVGHARPDDPVRDPAAP